MPVDANVSYPLSALPYLPMSTQLISRVETITPVLTEEYLRHNTKNRQLRKNLVSFYAEQMRKGQWMLNGEAIIFNEQDTLVDGQHRLAAVIEADKGIDMLVVRNADKDSFATIDSGVSRKVQDTFYVKGIPSASGGIGYYRSLSQACGRIGHRQESDGQERCKRDVASGLVA